MSNVFFSCSPKWAREGQRPPFVYVEIFRNKKAFRYDIKQIDSMLPCVCSIIDHRGRQNVVRTKKWHTRRQPSVSPRVPPICSFFFQSAVLIQEIRVFHYI